MPFGPNYSRTKTFQNAGTILSADLNDIQDDLGGRISALSVVLAALPGSPTSGQVILYQTSAMATLGHPPQSLRWNGSVWQHITGGSELLRRGLLSAYRSSNVALGTGSPVIFDSEEFDVSGWYDTTTGLYTPAVAGYYRISWLVSGGTGAANGFFQTSLLKSGAPLKVGEWGWSNSGVAIANGGSVLVFANGTDTFGVRIENHIGTFNVLGSAAQTYLQAEMVAAA